jgi:PAS domain S-box-containing protein
LQKITWLNFQDLLSSLEQVNDLGLCLLDKKGVIVTINEVASLILNAEAEHLPGHAFSDVFPEHDATTLLQGHQAFLEHGSLHPLQSMELDFKVTLIRSELDGEPGVLMLMQEEQAERISSDYWSKVALRSLDEAIVITDREGIVQYMNEGAERLTKTDKTSAVGQHVNKTMILLDSETELRTTIPLEKVLEGSQFTSGGTHLLLNHKGQKLSISEFITPWRDSLGTTKGMVIAFRERRRTAETPMRGAIEDFEDALTLLQTITSVKREGALTLLHEDSQYVFYLKDGRLVHFEHQEFDNAAALIQVSKLERGSFTFDPAVRPPKQTTNQDMMSLILDLARHTDEVKRTRVETIPLS